jgi:hypothetical protein
VNLRQTQTSEMHFINQCKKNIRKASFNCKLVFFELFADVKSRCESARCDAAILRQRLRFYDGVDGTAQTLTTGMGTVWVWPTACVQLYRYLPVGFNYR